MPSAQILSNFELFTDIDGSPLNSGYIFIGSVASDPESSPIPAFWDILLTVPAVQPIRTKGGYPSNGGTPSRIYVGAASYSVRVRNKKGTIVYADPDLVPRATGIESFGAIGDGVANDSLAFTNLETVFSGQEVDLLTKTYLVDSFPLGNRYFNGSFKRVSDGLVVQTANTGVLRTGNNNVLIGRGVAPALVDYSYTDPLGTGRGYNLTAIGANAMALAGNDSYSCTAVGPRAMYSNKYGHYNIAIGLEAMYFTGINAPVGPFDATRIVAIGDNAKRFNTTGNRSIAIGRNADQVGTTAIGNVFIGAGAGAGAAPLDISGVIVNPFPRTAGLQTAVGLSALDYSNGISNTAVGANSASLIKIGNGNVSVGYFSLGRLEVGTSPDGFESIVSSLAGTWAQVDSEITVSMTAHGLLPGFRVKLTVTGAPSTPDVQYWTVATVINANTWTAAAPDSATRSGTCTRLEYYTNTPVAPSSGNTAVGNNSMGLAPRGNNNTAVGSSSLVNCASDSNTGVGSLCLNALTSSTQCTGVGYSALRFATGGQNTAVGEFAAGALVSGSGVTALGRNALRGMQDGSPGATMTNTLGVGADSRVSGDNQAQIGNSSTTTYVYGTVQNRSDVRDKTDIRATSLGLDFILALEPVDYRWDMRDDYIDWKLDEETGEEVSVVRERDGSKARNRFHHGFIAQEVEKVIRESGVDFGGFQDHSVHGGCEVQSLGYDEFIAPMVKAIQELTARLKALEEKK